MRTSWRGRGGARRLAGALLFAVALALCGCGEWSEPALYPAYEDAAYTACSEYRYTPEGVHAVAIDYLDGDIALETGGSTTLFLREASAGLPDEHKMHIAVIGDELHIRYCAPGAALGDIDAAAKVLTLQLPASVSLEVNTISARVRGEGLTLHRPLTVKSVSGDIALRDLTSPSVDIEASEGDISLETPIISGEATLHTLSGGISLDALTADFLQVESVGGDIAVRVLSCRDLLATTVDGDIALSLSPAGEEDSGAAARATALVLTRRTLSGKLTSNLPSREENGKTIFGEDAPEYARCYAEVKTTRGNVRVGE